jgi:hypothetical protein
VGIAGVTFSGLIEYSTSSAIAIDLTCLQQEFVWIGDHSFGYGAGARLGL